LIIGRGRRTCALTTTGGKQEAGNNIIQQCVEGENKSGGLYVWDYEGNKQTYK
jgi:hypothetical protein